MYFEKKHYKKVQIGLMIYETLCIAGVSQQRETPARDALILRGVFRLPLEVSEGARPGIAELCEFYTQRCLPGSA